MGDDLEIIGWRNGRVRMIDQTLLPAELVYIDCDSVECVAEAIERLRIRGAPAIGVAAAYGMALAAHLGDDLPAAHDRLARTRPTAVNLFWALDRVMRVVHAHDGDELPARLLEEARAIHREEVEACRAMGRHGAELLGESARVLTHCNAGALATAGYGTALGVIRAAAELGRVSMVYADETRPLLQGSRLTAWELSADGIPVTVIADSMAAQLMRQGRVDCVITGADRIAANGDAANKIGTYGVAVLARHHGIPMYVAAPVSTFDFDLASGDQIPIEERGAEELRAIRDVATAPDAAGVYNPAFDVTPHELITAIITERGVFRPPYGETLAALRG